MASTINASTSPAAIIQTADGTGILSLQTGNTTALTIDTSQNVGIGTTSPIAKLDVVGLGSSGFGISNRSSGTTSYSATGAAGNDYSTSFRASYLRQNDTATTGTTAGITNVNLGVLAFQNTDNALIYTNGANPLIFGTLSAERMRIDSSGNLLINTTTAGTTNTQGWGFNINSNACYLSIGHITGSGNGNPYINFNYNGTSIGGIVQTTTSSVSYNTTSDYRLKENVAPLTGALDKVAQLKPVTYKWKLGGENGQGFIAHELQAVVPDCVTGEKDAVDAEGNPKYQGVDTSFLVATLTAAIQELAKASSEQQALITSLTARITALEGA